jgi:hypothetical protein
LELETGKAMLIHATIIITGASEEREACEVQLRRALAGQLRRDDVTEHSGRDALCYDLKVEGGIPFPVFARASEEFPALEFAIDWLNVAAGERGSARFVGGHLAAQTSERIGAAFASDHPVYVAVATDGTLTLALTLDRVAANEWLGYGVTATRDALLRILREPGRDELTLYATEGAPEWAAVWTGNLSAGQFHFQEGQEPIAIANSVFQDLDQMARGFAEAWLWFADAPKQEIAIERERYVRYGYKTADANLRSARLHQLRTEAEEGKPLKISTLSADETWLKDVVLATWARNE